VVVATDEKSIKDAVEAFGGEAVLTRHDHATATDRVAEVALHEPAEIYVNVQGDEPLIDPGTIDSVISAMLEDEAMQIGTPCTAIDQPNDIMDPNVVKVVRNFSKATPSIFRELPLPWIRERSATAGARHWKHLGLLRLPPGGAGRVSDAFPPGELERVERLEQLRWLENGFVIGVVETDYDAVSVRCSR